MTPEERAAACLKLCPDKSMNDATMVPGDLYQRIVKAIRDAVAEERQTLDGQADRQVGKMALDAKDCKHLEFSCNVVVQRLEDVGRFVADVSVFCLDCGTPFRFLGLPGGLDLNLPTVSPGGIEARLPIAPVGLTVPPVAGVRGFTIRPIK